MAKNKPSSQLLVLVLRIIGVSFRGSAFCFDRPTGHYSIFSPSLLPASYLQPHCILGFGWKEAVGKAATTLKYNKSGSDP